MKKKRLARVIIAAVVTTAILVAIIVGCGPKWGDGSANVNGSNSNSSNSASDNVSSNDNAAQSNNNYATRITVKLLLLFGEHGFPTWENAGSQRNGHHFTTRKSC